MTLLDDLHLGLADGALELGVCEPDEAAVGRVVSVKFHEGVAVGHIVLLNIIITVGFTNSD